MGFLTQFADEYEQVGLMKRDLMILWLKAVVKIPKEDPFKKVLFRFALGSINQLLDDKVLSRVAVTMPTM